MGFSCMILIGFAMAPIGEILALPVEDGGRLRNETIITVATDVSHTDAYGLKIMRSLETLESLGIHGLCHPTSNSFAPAFLRCGEEGEEEGTTTNTRSLQYQYTAQDYDFYNDQDETEPKTLESLVINGCLALICVLAGALASGLTVGLLSLDPLLLLIKIRAGKTPSERQQAETLLPLIKKHHDLLVTLLLLNTVAGEALPVFLQSLVPDSVAILMSVVMVLIFGEILPTAIFVGPNQLKLASQLAPLVNVLMVIMTPLTYPIARLLDRIMRHDNHDSDNDEDDGGDASHGSLYNRVELAALIRVQHEERLAARQRRRHQRSASLVEVPDLDHSDVQIAEGVRTLKQELIHLNQSNQNTTWSTNPSSDSSLHNDEVTIMEGALQMKTKRAVDIYLSYHKVFCIPADTPLDDNGIFTIYASGYSRVPVFVDNDRRRIKGILMTRQLIVVGKNAGTGATTDSSAQVFQVVSDLNLHVPQCVHPHTNLIDLVNLFQTGGSAVRTGHMALVCAEPEIANAALDRGEAIPADAGVMG